jgi:phosphoglycolate phosphatase
MVKKYKAIIFDLDGTLLDSIEGICFSINEAISFLYPGQRVEINELKPLMGLSIDAIIRELKPELNEKEISLFMIKFREVYDQKGWQIGKLYDHVEDTLKILQKNRVNLLLATNKPSYATNKILDYYGMSEYLVDTMTPDHISGLRLSKREMINKLVAKRSLILKGTLFVGDTISDAKASQDNGIEFAMALYGYGSKLNRNDEMIDYDINSISEIIKISKGEI